jgi:hypothetical protein
LAGAAVGLAVAERDAVGLDTALADDLTETVKFSGLAALEEATGDEGDLTDFTSFVAALAAAAGVATCGEELFDLAIPISWGESYWRRLEGLPHRLTPVKET